jgi:hypothetical protein
MQLNLGNADFAYLGGWVALFGFISSEYGVWLMQP